MAFQVVDQTYSGTYSDFFITRATYGMDTVRKGIVHIVSDIKKKHTIARLDYQNPLRPNAADPVPNNNNPFKMDGRLLVPQSVDVYEEFNPRDLEENQLAEQLSSTIIDRDVPAELQSQLIQLVLNRAGEKYEDACWMGSLDYFGNVPDTDDRYQLQYFNGYMQRIVNDPIVNKSSITPATIDKTNILTIMNDLIVQATLKGKALIVDPFAFDRMKFIMSATTVSIYGEALRDANFKGLELESGFIPRWAGYKVERIAGCPDDTILFLRATDEAMNTNLFAGMNSMSDWDLKCMRKANNSELFFIQGKWKWDVNYGWPEEMFVFTTLVNTDFQLP